MRNIPATLIDFHANKNGQWHPTHISWRIGSFSSLDWFSLTLFPHKEYARILRVTLIFFMAIAGCTSEHQIDKSKLTRHEKEKPATNSVRQEIGEASWYGPGFQGKETSSGEIFDQREMTAAHPSLPMGTKAKITNLENNQKVEVRINDRGPYAEDRAIDLSGAAAKKLDMKKEGTAHVLIESEANQKKSVNTESSKKK